MAVFGETTGQTAEGRQGRYIGGATLSGKVDWGTVTCSTWVGFRYTYLTLVAHIIVSWSSALASLTNIPKSASSDVASPKVSYHSTYLGYLD